MPPRDLVKLPIALDGVRWGFVAVPLVSLWPVHNPWIWPLIGVTLVVSLPLLWLPSTPAWLMPASLAITVLASGTLWTLDPRSMCSISMFLAVFQSVRLQSGWQRAVLVTLGAAAPIGLGLQHRSDWGGALPHFAILAVVVLLGLNRRARVAKLEQTELAPARAQTASEEHAVAAALGERARIARELHDVLAHSLSGLALNLQGTRLMLQRDGASPDAVAQIERAQRLAVEGLSEARKAVAALRDDPVPVQRAVADLLDGYRLDTGAAAKLIVHGETRDLTAAGSTTVARAVQEALSNTRKHAPGAAVEVTLGYPPEAVEVTVRDHQDARPSPSGPAGYGLRGMGERVELLGGELGTGPVEDGWRVHLVIPG